MGAWGEKAFQNDSALDWLTSFEASGVAMLRDTLSRVADTDENDEVDVDDGACAIAAAEIVAAAFGCGTDRVPKEARVWIDCNQGSLGANDVTLAKRAVGRVLAAGSELCELWDEGGPDNAWREDVHALLSRLVEAPAVEEPNQPATNVRPLFRAPIGEREKQAIIAFLGARGMHPTAKQLARIHASKDIVEIRRWLTRVVNATSVAGMLDD